MYKLKGIYMFYNILFFRYYDTTNNLLRGQMNISDKRERSKLKNVIRKLKNKLDDLEIEYGSDKSYIQLYKVIIYEDPEMKNKTKHCIIELENEEQCLEERTLRKYSRVDYDKGNHKILITYKTREGKNHHTSFNVPNEEETFSYIITEMIKTHLRHKNIKYEGDILEYYHKVRKYTRV